MFESSGWERTVTGRLGGEAWIFQCPEESYTTWISGVGSEGSVYKTPQNHRLMKEGDLVFVWVSGKYSGIRALTTITDLDARPYLLYTSGNYGTPTVKDKWVGLGPLEILPQRVDRKELKEDPRLEELTILKSAMGSIFKVSPRQREVLDEYVYRQFAREGVGMGSMFSGRQLAEDVGDVMAAKLRMPRPAIEAAPELTDDSVPEAWFLSFPALGDARLFVRCSGHQCEAGLMLDEGSAGSYGQRHPVDELGEFIWENLSPIKEEGLIEGPYWGRGLPLAVENGVLFAEADAVSGWYKSPGARWVAVSIHLPPDVTRFDVSTRLANALIALDCLSIRADGRVVMTPVEPVSVFVSYSRSDWKWVKKELIPQLESAAGRTLQFLWDADLEPGESWTAQLDRWINDCDAALLVVSKSSLNPKRFTWKEEVPRLLERRAEDRIPLVGILRKELGAEGLDQLQEAGISLVNGDRKKVGEPVFPIASHKWNLTAIRDLIRRSG